MVNCNRFNWIRYCVEFNDLDSGSKWLDLMIPDQFFQEIQGFDPILMNVSGGMDSTYTALQFHKRNIPVMLVHNNSFF